MITYSTPISLSISAEISPVNAPLFLKWQFSAPTLILVPLVNSSAVSRLVYGTQMITPQVLSAAMGLSALISSAASALFLFIFQLPAITACLNALFMMIMTPNL